MLTGVQTEMWTSYDYENAPNKIDYNLLSLIELSPLPTPHSLKLSQFLTA